MQPAGGVDDDGVGSALQSGAHGVERDRRGIPAGSTAHHRGADPVAPRLELICRGGPERVGRAEDDVLAVGDQDPGEFAGGGGLAGAVDAHDEDHGRPAVLSARDAAVHGRVDQGEQLLAQDGADPRGVAGALDPGACAQPADELLGGTHPEIGLQQQRLDVLPVLLGELVAREQGEQAAAHGVLAAGQPRPQPDQAAGGGGRDLERRRGGCGRGQRAGAGARRDRGGRGRRQLGRRPAPAAQQEGAADEHEQDDGDGDQDVRKGVLHASGLSIGDERSRRVGLPASIVPHVGHSPARSASSEPGSGPSTALDTLTRRTTAQLPTSDSSCVQ